MKVFRPYHFPPLARLRASAEAGSGWQATLDAGFEQGRRDGYHQGLADGRAEGYAAGHAEGLAHGMQEARREALLQFEQAVRPVDNVLRALKKLRTDLRAAQGREVVDLVGKVARQVIRAELALQPVQLLALVEEALAAMPPTRDQVEVCLNPEELRRIQELDPKRARKWSLLPDAALAPGECRVRAGDLEADAGCHARLAAVMDQVGLQVVGEELAA